MNNKRQAITLELAYSWKCPNCGKWNFAKAVPFSLTKEDENQIRNEMGVGPEEMGELVTSPDEVTCINPECLSIFKIQDPNEDDIK